MRKKQNQVFPVVSMGKFTVLYFTTLGLYRFYWFYQCWEGIDKVKPTRESLIGRMIVAAFFPHSLFRAISKIESERGEPYHWNPSKLAWIYIYAWVIGGVLSVFPPELQPGAILGLLIHLIVLSARFYSLYQVQLVMNRSEGDAFGRSNQVLSLHNNLWIAFGLFLWVGKIHLTYLHATGQLPQQIEMHKAKEGDPNLPSGKPEQGLDFGE